MMLQRIEINQMRSWSLTHSLTHSLNQSFTHSLIQIDTIHFDPDEYVRELLEKSPLETLVAKDTDMTHEIRTLDSDMQMLVYENYSKFISATETIKRMKSNMDSMEHDMELLRNKMKSITITSSSLDETLYDKRNKLSKLIRLNRLLDKLQFLSELPEKLASLIDQEQYKQAVKLYNKTINILTSHSHVSYLQYFVTSFSLTHSLTQVLSFKNIQLRTEKMMSDLRTKVITLLDDVNLQPHSLTQHVSVLRLMEAPRNQVIEKFINAHKLRTERAISSFNKYISSTVTTDSTQIVNEVRKFHQLFIAGLIESCKGTNELFCEADERNTVIYTPNSNSKIGSGKPSSTEGMHSTDQFLSPPRVRANSSHMTHSCYTDPSVTRIDAARTNELLSSLFTSIIPEYTRALQLILVNFVKKYNSVCDAAQTGSSFGTNTDGGNTDGSSSTNMQLLMYDLEEEKQQWIMLIRQSILDCQYLESSFVECVRLLNSHNDDINIPNDRFYTSNFTNVMTEVLDKQVRGSLVRRVNSIGKNLQEKIPEMVKLCTNIALPSSNTATNPFEDDASIGLSTRTSIQSNTSLLQGLTGGIVENIVTTFNEVCNDIKPFLELVTLTSPTTSGKADSSQKYSFRYLHSFFVELVSSFKALCSITSADHQEISCENRVNIDTNVKLPIDNPQEILLYSIMTRLYSATALKKVEQIVSNYEIDVPDYTEYEQQIVALMTTLNKQLLMAYINRVSLHYSDMICTRLKSMSYEASSVIQLDTSTILPLALSCDHMLTATCIALNEPVPILKALAIDRDISRRERNRQSMHNTRASAGQLQIDIEKLFSQKIVIYDDECILKDATSHVGGSRSNNYYVADVILGTSMKAIIKCYHEVVREMVLVSSSYIDIQVDLTFLKQISSCLLRDSVDVTGSNTSYSTTFYRDVEALIESTLTVMYSRCLKHDMTGSADELTGIVKAATEGLATASRSSYLLPK